MKNLIGKLLVAATLLLGASAANATVYPVANLDGYTATLKANGFSAFSFSLKSDSNITVDYSTTKTKGLNFGAIIASLFNTTTGQMVDLSGSSWLKFGQETDSFSFDGLSSGKYLLGLTTLGNSKVNLSFQVAAVPEPETYALMGVGLLGLLAARRKSKKGSTAVAA